ncbi:MAG TPA: 30S ribosomal protein S4 [Methanomicrobiales archaeon]|nr:30S ribosomal protein S4 [Methanomicrobiales archaeon]
MGYPGKNRKQYEKPTRKFEKQRQADEVKLLITYGLRNKREVWKSQMVLRRFRRAARDITALSSAGVDPKIVEAKKRQMFDHLERMGFIGADASIEAILSLKVEQQLERRLQTIVYRKGLARSPKQARQFITHGHIMIGTKKVTIPGYHVSRAEEPQISYATHSPIANEVHPERARISKVGR